jgi:hypothetical protein
MLNARSVQIRVFFETGFAAPRDLQTIVNSPLRVSHYYQASEECRDNAAICVLISPLREIYSVNSATLRLRSSVGFFGQVLQRALNRGSNPTLGRVRFKYYGRLRFNTQSLAFLTGTESSYNDCDLCPSHDY